MAIPAAVIYLMSGHPNYIEAGFVEMELKNWSSRIFPIFYEDTEAVYHSLEKATWGTFYAAPLNQH